jgi:hypothetical protein
VAGTAQGTETRDSRIGFVEGFQTFDGVIEFG